ncbi:EthD family reductase [uncultured Pelagimonas sp.]|uniref:EthD family reductase n=1 Tax=uncultured Pelagimonas sp. TaxID=1618102 RepID=UPI0026373332|nr:EthD family reductase [uncultured Pelagimonas sp.]
MSVSLQVLYPVSTDATFDHDYYTATHIPLVGEHMGAHIQSTSISKGIAGGPDVPAGFYVVATMVFAAMENLQAALEVAGPVLADIPNFTNVAPQMLIGEIIS